MISDTRVRSVRSAPSVTEEVRMTSPHMPRINATCFNTRIYISIVNKILYNLLVICNISDFTLCILQQLPQELIYTTVDFKCHQKTFNIYANLDIHNSRPDLGNALPPQDNVEYASIAEVL